MSNTRLYGIWNKMKQRINNTSNTDYSLYGGRGITIADEWYEFTNFYNWSINNGYNDELSIDRINVNGNYEPSNCRWVDMKVQANNRTNNLIFSYNGISLTLSEWCDKLNLSYDKIWKRIYKYNYSFEKAINKK